MLFLEIGVFRWEVSALSTIRDAYISVEIEDAGLNLLRHGLRTLLGDAVKGCEVASNAAHVSIAYGDGDVDVEAIERVASEISALPFSVKVEGFEFLEGESTPFDYLVVKLESDGAFDAAVKAAKGSMKTKSFSGGFRSHISLLKFPKGSLDKKWAQQVVNEMNFCQLAANALGRFVSLKGDNVSVYGADRKCRVKKQFRTAHQVS